MGGKRKRYSREFKWEAVRLLEERGESICQVARELELNASQLSRWKRELEEDPEESFPGQGRLKPRDEEVRQLRRENERLRQQLAILKKTVAIFSNGEGTIR